MLGVIAGAGLIRTSGHAAGSTRWSTPVITTRPDGSASIAMNVTYVDGDRQIGGIAILTIRWSREALVEALADWQ